MKSTASHTWEESDFPIACNVCLGPLKNLKMTKNPFGLECRVCLKPFTLFRWCPVPGGRFRRTEICSTCARLKDVCQSCLLDLKYGLPVQVRDNVLGVKESAPKQDANREFFLASRVNRLDTTQKLLTDTIDPAAHSILNALSSKNHRDPIESNKPLPCSFFAKGQCTRGEACPFRHELAEQPSSTLKSFRDRYYGENDASAKSYEQAVTALSVPFVPPEDRSITAFHIAGLSGRESVDELTEHFEGLFEDQIEGKRRVKHVRILEQNTAAIVSFKSRAFAEQAAKKAMGLVEVCGQPVRVTWANRPKSTHKYPSQDPERFGSK